MLIVDAVLRQLLMVRNLCISHGNQLVKTISENVHLLNEWLLLCLYSRTRGICVLFNLFDLKVELVYLTGWLSNQDVHLLNSVVLIWTSWLSGSVRLPSSADCLTSGRFSSSVVTAVQFTKFGSCGGVFCNLIRIAKARWVFKADGSATGHTVIHRLQVKASIVQISSPCL